MSATFYRGAPEQRWLEQAGRPLFVSHTRLRRSLRPRARMPKAIARWACDSGGYTELLAHGEWRETPARFAAAALEYLTIGLLDFVVQQDYMCTRDVLDTTGLTVSEHQRRTVDLFGELRALAPTVPWAPVLQGTTTTSYIRHAEMFAGAGVALDREPIVCVGSIAGRQAHREARLIVSELADAGLRLHVLGVHSGLAAYGQRVASADSMAWSAWARHHRFRLTGCTHGGASCASCIRWMLVWGDRVERDAVLDPLARPGSLGAVAAS